MTALAAGRIRNNTPTKPESSRKKAIDQKAMLTGGKPGMLPEISVPRPLPVASPIRLPKRNKKVLLSRIAARYGGALP